MTPKFSPKHYTVYADRNLMKPEATLPTWLIRGAIMAVMVATGVTFRHPIGLAIRALLG